MNSQSNYNLGEAALKGALKGLKTDYNLADGHSFSDHVQLVLAETELKAGNREEALIHLSKITNPNSRAKDLLALLSGEEVKLVPSPKAIKAMEKLAAKKEVSPEDVLELMTFSLNHQNQSGELDMSQFGITLPEEKPVTTVNKYTATGNIEGLVKELKSALPENATIDEIISHYCTVKEDGTIEF